MLPVLAVVELLVAILMHLFSFLSDCSIVGHHGMHVMCTGVISC